MLVSTVAMRASLVKLASLIFVSVSIATSLSLENSLILARDISTQILSDSTSIPYLTKTRIVGPAPTTFTLPEECTVPFLAWWDEISQTGTWQYGGSGSCESYYLGYFSAYSSCFPDGYSSEKAPDAYQIYTYTSTLYYPQACPNKWTVRSIYTRRNYSVDEEPMYLTAWLEEGEAVTLCCPTGWDIHEFATGPATSVACFSEGIDPRQIQGASSTLVRVCGSGNQDPKSIFLEYNPDAVSITGSMPLVALMAVASTSLTSPPPTSTPETLDPDDVYITRFVLPTQTATPPPDQPQENKSHKVAIAIGIVIGVFVVVPGLILVGYIYRRKQKKSKKDLLLVPGSAELPTFRDPVELDGKPGPFEVDAIPEMPANREWDRCATVAGRLNSPREGETGWE